MKPRPLVKAFDGFSRIIELMCRTADAPQFNSTNTELCTVKAENALHLEPAIQRRQAELLGRHRQLRVTLVWRSESVSHKLEFGLLCILTNYNTVSKWPGWSDIDRSFLAPCSVCIFFIFTRTVPELDLSYDVPSR